MKPQYFPKTTEQRLGYLVEECGEVLAAVGKAQRWGLESFNPELPVVDPRLRSGGRATNRRWILREIADLENAIALAKFALNEGVIPAAPPTTEEPK